MLINQDDILRRFSENLEWADRIDLATAWATPHDGLQALQKRERPLRVRAIVGLGGNTTDPLALRKLADIGELRTPNENEARRRLFHPKVYVFRSNRKSVAWIGSANFTWGGFGGNEEALFETSDTRSVKTWFDLLWRRCTVLDEPAIIEYEAMRITNPPRPRAPSYVVDSEPMQLLEAVDDWKSYVEALEQCDQWWRSKGYLYSVLGEPCSWRETIQILHGLIRQDWSTLGDYHQKCLLAKTGEERWGLLGGLPSPGVQSTVFVHNRARIQNTIHHVIAASDGFPDVAIDAYSQLTGIDGVGKAAATRLLALAKPDRFVSLNGRSEKGLARFSGLAPSTLKRPQNYRRLLEHIYEQPWFREPDPDPKNVHEQTICWMRVALLDCFVFEPP